MKGGVFEKEKQQKASRKQAAVLTANAHQLRKPKLPLHRGGGDGAFSVICFDIILHAGSLHLVYVTEKPVFALTGAEGDLQ